MEASRTLLSRHGSIGWVLRTPELWAATLTLVAGLAVGFAMVPPRMQPPTDPAPRASSSPHVETVSNISSPGSELDVPFVPVALWNIVVLVMLLLGLVTGGLSAIITLFVTGFQIGLTVAAALAAGMPPVTVVSLIALHAPFELLGLLLAGAVGMSGLGLLLEKQDGWQPHYLPIAGAALCLVLVGAIVESAVSPLMVGP